MRSILFIVALTASAIILFASTSLQRVPFALDAAFTVEKLPEQRTSPFSVKHDERVRAPGLTPAPDKSRFRWSGMPNGSRPTTGRLVPDTLKSDRSFAAALTMRLTPRRARLLDVDPLISRQTHVVRDSTIIRRPSADSDDAVARARYRSVDSVSIRLASDAELTTLPNRTLTAVFAVMNSGRLFRKVHALVDVPAGWVLVRAPVDLELAPASTTVHFVTLKLPPDASAGNAEIGLSLEEAGSRAFLASATILVTVETVYKVALEPKSQPDFVPAGEPYEVTFMLGNHGNVRTSVKLELDEASTGTVSLSVNEVEIDPGESLEIRAVVKTQADLVRLETKRFNVSAEAVGPRAVSAVASSAVDVVPIYGRVDPRARPMDVVLTVGVVGDEQDAAVLYRAEGSGEIFGGALDFNLRFPDRQDVARLGQRDEYRSSFRSENLSVVVGDQSFNLSPLTTVGDYAFGVGSTVRTGMLEVDAFAQRSRASILDYSLAGGGVQIRSSDQAAFGINLLHRDGLYDGTITTLRSIVSPFDGAEMDFECGIDDMGSVSNPACSVAVAGRMSQVVYRGRFLRTSENYPGSSSDLTNGSAGLELRLPKGWTVRGDFNALDRGGSTGVARNYWSSITGIGYRAGFGRTSFDGNLQFMASNEEFAGTGSMLDRSEQTLRFSSSFHIPAASVSLAVDIGHAESEARGYSGSVRVESLRLRLNPGHSYDVGGFIDHHSGFVSSAPVEVDRWFSGLQAGWMPKRDTRIRGSISRSLEDNVIRRTYTMYEGRLDHSLPWGHRITAQVRRTVDDGRSRFAFTDYRFGYSVPLSLPLPSTSPSSRKVFGRVYDMATGQGLEGILLHLGDRMTLTDASGRFRFPAPLLETEYLRVDQRSIGIDRVSKTAMPYPVNPGQRDVEIDIPIVAGANLSGILTRYGSPRRQPLIGELEPLEPVEGIRNAIVEARSGDRVFRARTNERGRFIITNIPPGDYVLRIVRAPIPGRHRWEADRIEIALQPAEERTVRFKLVPIKRKIRLIEGGSVRTVRGPATRR